MGTIKVTVSATKRDAQPKVITRYLDRIIKELPDNEVISRDLMGSAATTTRHQPPQSLTSEKIPACDEPTNRPLTREDVRKLWAATSENKSAQKRQQSRASPLRDTPVETQLAQNTEPQATPPSHAAPADEQHYSLNNPTLPPLTEQDFLDLHDRPRRPRPKDARQPSTKPQRRQNTPPTDGRPRRRTEDRPPAHSRYTTDDKLKRRSVAHSNVARERSRPTQEPHGQRPDNKRLRRSASFPPTLEDRRAVKATATAAMTAFNARLDPVFKKMGEQ